MNAVFISFKRRRHRRWVCDCEAGDRRRRLVGQYPPADCRLWATSAAVCATKCHWHRLSVGPSTVSRHGHRYHAASCPDRRTRQKLSRPAAASSATRWTLSGPAVCQPAYKPNIPDKNHKSPIEGSKVEAKRGQQVMVLLSQSQIRHCPLAMAAPTYGGPAPMFSMFIQNIYYIYFEIAPKSAMRLAVGRFTFKLEAFRLPTVVLALTSIL